MGWLAAAAAAILALGLGVYALQLRSQVERLQADLDATAARLATTEAEARGSIAPGSRARRPRPSILTAADLRRVDLAGQKGAPRAAARAFWSRAQGLVLTATRLPDLPEGRTYQLWVLTSGAPISAGHLPARRVGRHVDGVRYARVPAAAGRHGRVRGAGRWRAGADRRHRARRQGGVD